MESSLRGARDVACCVWQAPSVSLFRPTSSSLSEHRPLPIELRSELLGSFAIGTERVDIHE
jgi:hypothetical protein